MTRVHVPELHLAQQMVAAFEHALHRGLSHHEDPARAVPPSADWPEWHWDGKGGDW